MAEIKVTGKGIAQEVRFLCAKTVGDAVCIKVESKEGMLEAEMRFSAHEGFVLGNFLTTILKHPDLNSQH